MAGGSVAYAKGVPLNVTQLAGLAVTIIGAVGREKVGSDLADLSRGDSQGWRDQPEAIVVTAGVGDDRIRLMVGQRALLGAPWSATRRGRSRFSG